MKILTLSLFALSFLSLPLRAQSVISPDRQKVNVQELKATHDPNDVSFLAVPGNVDGIVPSGDTPKVAKRMVARQLPRQDEAVVDTVQYFTIAQSYHKNYTFNYDGGDIYYYNVGLAINGTKATFTNLFDMYNQSATSWARSYDYPVDGVYDADAKTITIPTTTSGVVCGNYGGYYDVYLLAGTVSENGSLTPDENLVFDVVTNDDGSIASLTARSSMLAKYTYGTIRVYKSFSSNLPQPGEANIKTFVESEDFGETFVDTETKKEITLYNTGGMDAEFVMELESEDDVFTSETMSGVVPAKGAFTLPFSFVSSKAGTYEGIVTLTYDSGNGEKTLVIDLAATAKQYPDYSAAVKSGDFKMTTGIEFPFEIATLDDGTPIAQSGTHGKYGTSWLQLDFTVPEGKLGKVSWKGLFNNSSLWYQNAGGYFVDTLDGAKVSLTGANEDFSGDWEFAPGKHFIRYQYEGQAYTGLEENRLYLYDIAYDETQLLADSAALLTPVVDFGNDILKPGDNSQKSSVITLKNMGANNLVVKSVTSSSSEFSADLSGLTSVGTMEELAIPVMLEAKTSGEKETTFTIETSAGQFEVKGTASVLDMPDFASLVTEGAEYISGWEVNPDAPFVIENGKAINKNSGVNNIAETAWFKMNLNIPEGKLAYVSWEGHGKGRPEDNVNYSQYYSSYATLEMSHPMNTGNTSEYGENIDISSSVVGADEYWSDFLACVPGTHYYKWGWYHNGDGTVPEGDYVEISNIKIHVIDFQANNVEVETPEITFDSVYVGYNRYATAKVTLRNTGSSQLSVGEVSGEAPFYAIETTNVAQFNKTIDVTLWFYPSEAGSFDGTVTLKTSAGDVQVKCHGIAENASDKGYIYLGDFEDVAYGWTTADADNDGETWNLGSNLWGDRPEYCHSGNECLASVSYSNYLGAITPDNWTLSPVITIPADGAKLSYYVAAFSPSRFEEHYSVYVHPYDSTSVSVDDVSSETPLFSETLKEENGAMDGWTLRQFDLDEYAGKQVVICFRHHDCNGQYILRLDDVNVMTKNGADAISSANKNVAGNAVEYFTLDGCKTDKLNRGINIVRTQNENGNVVVRKVIR